MKYRARRKKKPFSEGVDPTVGLPYFLRYLRMIAALCKQAKVPLVLMTQPTLYKAEMSPEEDAALWLGYIRHGDGRGHLNLDTPTLLKGQQAFNDGIREMAKEERLGLIDLDPALPKDLEHFYDDAHYTPKGNAVVADVIVKALLDRGSLP